MQRDIYAKIVAKLKQVATIISGINTDISGVKTDVQTLQTSVSGLSTDVTGLQTSVSGLSTDITGLQTSVSGLQTNVSGLSTDVTGLQTSVSGLNTDVTGLQTTVNAIPNFKLFTGVKTFDSNGKCTITDSFITSGTKAFVNAAYDNITALTFSASCSNGSITIAVYNTLTKEAFTGDFNTNILCVK